MKNKNIVTIALVLAIAVTTLAFGSQSPLTRGLFNSALQTNAQTSSQIPSYVLYDKLFRMIISFKKKAESQEMSGERIISVTNYFKDRANLNEEENQTLQNTALEYTQKIALIDEQARTIIVQTRQAISTGVVSRNQPPPAELANLQEQRNQMALLYRDRLKESLGSDGSAKFARYIEGEFASRFESIPLSSINFEEGQ